MVGGWFLVAQRLVVDCSLVGDRVLVGCWLLLFGCWLIGGGWRLVGGWFVVVGGWSVSGWLVVA